MRRGTNPVFIHVAADGTLLTPERNNRDQSAVLDLDPTTKILGVNLGSDYCAEHEWGIKDLYRAFGIKHEINVYGLKKRKISKLPSTLVWVKLADGREGFAYRNFWYDNKPKEILDRDSELVPYETYDRTLRKMVPAAKQLVGAWSESNFGVFSKNPDDIAMLNEIYSHFGKKNIVFTFSAALPAFDNPGLIIAIADRLPKEVIKMWTDADKEAHEIEKFVVKSKIRETLEKAGKKYFALSPKRAKDGTIEFWLNPYDQDKNNFGWFKLDDLRAWAKNEGRIPMSAAQLLEQHERRHGKQTTAVH